MNVVAYLSGMGVGAVIGCPLAWITAKVIAWREQRNGRWL